MRGSFAPAAKAAPSSIPLTTPLWATCLSFSPRTAAAVGRKSARRWRRSLRPAANPRKEPAVKRQHVHIAVDDLNKSIGFYSTLFGAQPSVLKDDYAKWMLEDPKVNLAISQR